MYKNGYRLTHVHQPTRIIECSQVGSGEREEGVQSREQRPHLWPSQSTPHNYRSQRMGDEGNASGIKGAAIDMVEYLGNQPK